MSYDRKFEPTENPPGMFEFEPYVGSDSVVISFTTTVPPVSFQDMSDVSAVSVSISVYP